MFEHDEDCAAACNGSVCDGHDKVIMLVPLKNIGPLKTGSRSFGQNRGENDGTRQTHDYIYQSGVKRRHHRNYHEHKHPHREG